MPLYSAYRPRRGRIVFDARIRGGLPVTVEAVIYPAEPDVGIFDPQVEITNIYWQSAKAWPPRPVPDKLFDWALANDREELAQLALEAACD